MGLCLEIDGSRAGKRTVSSPRTTMYLQILQNLPFMGLCRERREYDVTVRCEKRHHEPGLVRESTE